MNINKNKNTILPDTVPVRNLAWETQDNKIILLVPKFRNRLTSRWLQPLLKKPFIRIHLDEHGSFVWESCDGHTSVREISSRMKEKFGNTVEQAEERTGRFIRMLLRDKFVHLNHTES